MTEPATTAEAASASRATTFRAYLDRGLDESYRFAAVVLGDAVEAEDAVHDAAILAWRRWATLRDRDRFDAWFGRILVNVCRDRLRRRRRIEIVDLSLPASTGDPARAAVDRMALFQAIERLDADHRITLVLRYLLDLPVDAVADRLAVPPGTVKSRLHYALRRLRDDLGPER